MSLHAVSIEIYGPSLEVLSGVQPEGESYDKNKHTQLYK